MGMSHCPAAGAALCAKVIGDSRVYRGYLHGLPWELGVVQGLDSVVDSIVDQIQGEKTRIR